MEFLGRALRVFAPIVVDSEPGPWREFRLRDNVNIQRGEPAEVGVVKDCPTLPFCLMELGIRSDRPFSIDGSDGPSRCGQGGRGTQGGRPGG